MKILMLCALHLAAAATGQATIGNNTVKTVADDDVTIHPRGSIVDIDEKEAKRLIARGLAQPTDQDVTPAAQAAPAVASEAEEFFRHLNAVEAIGHLETVATVPELNALKAIENGRPGGPRKTVLSAFEARFTELTDGAQLG